MTEITGVHPLADKWIIYPDVLAEVTESIRANGQRHPIVLDTEGLIIDGRTRYQACVALDIEPSTTVYAGSDVLEYIWDANSSRRHVSTAARAMTVAEMLVEDGRRESGKWAYGALSNSPTLEGSFHQRVSEAGVVLDWAAELAAQVKDGSLRLDRAYAMAKEKRNKVDAEKQAAAIEASRKREATIREREENDRKLAALTKDQSRFLTNIQTGDMTIAIAYAAHQESTRKQREEQRQIDAGRRDTCTRIAECVRYLDGGQEYANIFLQDFYPYESDHLPDGMRLTQTRLDSAIEFLTAIKKGVTR